MHLSSITIKGFKSFPERTRLAFSPGVSVIVGPNGCGKSNITDAVLWALGEQSPLSVRGQTMRDMIFAGGEGQGPRRYAEVEVVLDNGDGQITGGFSEIAITRRLDRSGEGEYRINGARCRLVDVIETLSEANLGGEMHSVISQGRVEEIVHSKPRERRLLIEEAAGLGRHRKRRRRAQLKLERTQLNLDRALDVEREARSRLRPLKRQAQAADIHARLDREAGELRASLLADDLRSQAGRLAEAERAARVAREERGRIEEELSAVNTRRTEIEERLASRESERTASWGRLTALRAAHERLTVRAEALRARTGELAAALAREREALGDLADPAADEARGGDPVAEGLERLGAELDAAIGALARARDASEGQRIAEVGRARSHAERAARAAARLEEVLGHRRQDSLERRLAARAEALATLESLREATEAARDASGERLRTLEARMVGGDDSEEFSRELRSCSHAEAELQARLRAIAESVTEAEVSAAHLRDRRDDATAELAGIAERLGHPLQAATEALKDAEREEIERKLARLATRGEQLGPVNPLAEQEYAEALEHVEELESQRRDLEAALRELEGLIRETDRKIESAFEETFEATRANFEELVEHLFPGGRGRLRLVGPQQLRQILGGGIDEGNEGEAGEARGLQPATNPATPGREGSELEPGTNPATPGREAEEVAGNGVEIEVTPAGKATRRLSLLSGGEKALVALAFVFAVFLARPSPFYILDEVEAALDDANIDRFLQLVRQFSDRAQFVIVTHQKRTMDAADVLYGVSMGAGGVSKVVSRRLPQGSEDEAAEPAPARAA